MCEKKQKTKSEHKKNKKNKNMKPGFPLAMMLLLSLELLRELHICLPYCICDERQKDSQQHQ